MWFGGEEKTGIHRILSNYIMDIIMETRQQLFSTLALLVREIFPLYVLAESVFSSRHFKTINAVILPQPRSPSGVSNHHWCYFIFRYFPPAVGRGRSTSSGNECLRPYQYALVVAAVVVAAASAVAAVRYVVT